MAVSPLPNRLVPVRAGAALRTELARRDPGDGGTHLISSTPCDDIIILSQGRFHDFASLPNWYTTEQVRLLFRKMFWLRTGSHTHKTPSKLLMKGLHAMMNITQPTDHRQAVCSSEISGTAQRARISGVPLTLGGAQIAYSGFWDITKRKGGLMYDESNGMRSSTSADEIVNKYIELKPDYWNNPGGQSKRAIHYHVAA
jgi:hypothetical protein